MRRAERLIQCRPAASLLGVAAVAALACSPALGAVSHAKFWQTSAKDVACGIAIHAPGQSARVLCSATSIPAPKAGVGFGDPGFVFLGAHGRPLLARLSQDTFESSSVLTLAPGSRWSSDGVSCSVHRALIRCANTSGHGFTIAGHSYVAF